MLARMPPRECHTPPTVQTNWVSAEILHYCTNERREAGGRSAFRVYAERLE